MSNANILLNFTPGDEAAVTFTRLSSGTAINALGQVFTANPDVMRIQYEDLDGDGIRETPGLLLEGSRTNYVLRSNEADNAYWGIQRASISANSATAPDGTSTADKMIEDASVSNSHQTFGNPVTITMGETISVSRFFKANTRTKVRLGAWDGNTNTQGFFTNFDLTAGTVGSGSAFGGGTNQGAAITQLGDGWYRCMARGTVGSGFATADFAVRMLDATGQESYTGDGVSGFYMWGAMLERAPFWSSFVATSATTVTRAADSLTLPFTFGLTDMTALAEIPRPVYADLTGDIGIYPGIMDIGNNAVLFNRLYFDGITRLVNSDIQTSGTSSFGQRSIPAGTTITAVAQWKDFATGGQTALNVGAGQSVFGTVASIHTSYGSQTLRIGGMTPATYNLYGVITRLVIARGLLTTLDMQALADRPYISWNDSTGRGQLTLTLPRFSSWTPDLVEAADSAVVVGTGVRYKTLYRTDYVATMVANNMKAVDLPLVMRLKQHLTNGGVAYVSTNDAKGNTYEVRLTAEGTVAISFANNQTQEYSISLDVKNTDAAPLLAYY